MVYARTGYVQEDDPTKDGIFGEDGIAEFLRKSWAPEKFGYEKVDAINYYVNKLIAHNNEVKELQEKHSKSLTNVDEEIQRKLLQRYDTRAAAFFENLTYQGAKTIQELSSKNPTFGGASRRPSAAAVPPVVPPGVSIAPSASLPKNTSSPGSAPQQPKPRKSLTESTIKGANFVPAQHQSVYTTPAKPPLHPQSAEQGQGIGFTSPFFSPTTSRATQILSKISIESLLFGPTPVDYSAAYDQEMKNLTQSQDGDGSMPPNGPPMHYSTYYYNAQQQMQQQARRPSSTPNTTSGGAGSSHGAMDVSAGGSIGPSGPAALSLPSIAEDENEHAAAHTPLSNSSQPELAHDIPNVAPFSTVAATVQPFSDPGHGLPQFSTHSFGGESTTSTVMTAGFTGNNVELHPSIASMLASDPTMKEWMKKASLDEGHSMIPDSNLMDSSANGGTSHGQYGLSRKRAPSSANVPVPPANDETSWRKESQAEMKAYLEQAKNFTPGPALTTGSANNSLHGSGGGVTTNSTGGMGGKRPSASSQLFQKMSNNSSHHGSVNGGPGIANPMHANSREPSVHGETAEARRATELSRMAKAALMSNSSTNVSLNKQTDASSHHDDYNSSQHSANNGLGESYYYVNNHSSHNNHLNTVSHPPNPQQTLNAHATQMTFQTQNHLNVSNHSYYDGNQPQSRQGHGGPAIQTRTGTGGFSSVLPTDMTAEQLDEYTRLSIEKAKIISEQGWKQTKLATG
jgi:hypothetical protein